MWSENSTRYAGAAGSIGGIFGVILAPVMVMVKYSTGWSVVPEPAWIAVVQPALGPLLTFTTPAGLWVIYGSIYTLALLLMSTGLLAFSAHLRDQDGRVKTKGLWVLLFGLCLVIPGDAVHTATWHQNGLTIPTPGTNVVANTAYAVHMMGMNFVMVGSLMIGITALRRKFLAAWLAWLFVSIFPAAVVITLTLLPTTPSGGLWLFSFMMMVLGYSLATQKIPLYPIAHNV